MSRTYRKPKYIPREIKYKEIITKTGFRRTKIYYGNGKYNIRYVCYHLYKWVPLSDKEKKRKLARLKKDGNKYFIWKNPPSWFRNIYDTRKLHQKTRMEINKIMKTGDYEDYIFDRHKRRETDRKHDQ